MKDATIPYDGVRFFLEAPMPYLPKKAEGCLLSCCGTLLRAPSLQNPTRQGQHEVPVAKMMTSADSMEPSFSGQFDLIRRTHPCKHTTFRVTELG